MQSFSITNQIYRDTGESKGGGSTGGLSIESTQSFRSNPLLKLGFEIPFERLTAEQIPTAIRALIEQGKQDIAAIINVNEPRTYQNTLQAFDRIALDLRRSWEIVEHLKVVVGHKELIGAISEVEQEYRKFETSIYLDKPLYDAIRAYAQVAGELPANQQRYLEFVLAKFEMSGVALPLEQKERLLNIEARLQQLGTSFLEKLSLAKEQVFIEVQRESELAGLPPQTIERAKSFAIKKNAPESWYLTLNANDVHDVMRFAEHAELRREMHEKFQGQCQQGELSNIPLCEEQLKLRSERAQILGKSNFCELAVSTLMAKTPEAVEEFVSDMIKATRPVMAARMLELRSLKREMTSQPEAELLPWDVGFYGERYRERKFGVDEKKVEEYFPLSAVLEGIFANFKADYGLEFVPNVQLPKWHPDVGCFDVFKDGEHLGAFYLDPYARSHKKPGAWMHTFIPQVEGLPGYEKYLGSMSLNISAPANGGEARVNFQDVKTIAHEFGHLLQAIITSPQLIGQAAFRWDIIELFSKMNENCTREVTTLQNLSRHVMTGEKIPAQMAEALIASTRFGLQGELHGQLGFTWLDYKLHTEYRPEDHGSIGDYVLKVLDAVRVLPALPYETLVARWSHLFGGAEYPGLYYSYLYGDSGQAEILARRRVEPSPGETNRRYLELTRRGDGIDPLAGLNWVLGRAADTPLDGREYLRSLQII